MVSEALGQALLGAGDHRALLHGLLQLRRQRVGVFVAAALEGGQQGRGLLVNLGLVNGAVRDGAAVGGGGLAGAASENQDVGEGVAAQAIRAVQARRRLARRVQAGDGAGGGLRVGLDAAHGVVDGRVDLHRLRGDVHVAQGVELLVHGGQFALDVVRAPVGDVQEDAAVGAAPARQDLLVDGAGDLVARQQFGRAAVVLFVLQPAVALPPRSRRTGPCSSPACIPA